MINAKIFKDIHKGQRCFIACNGPSLNDIDVKKLKNEFVFALNRGYLKKDLPITYLVVVDDIVEKQFRKELEMFECKAKFAHSLKGDNVVRLTFTPDIPKFIGNIEGEIWQGHSVTNSALNIAFYMGFKDVYIIGMDHTISYKEAVKKGNKYKTLEKDINHFNENYFPKGFLFTPQNLERVELGYKLAREFFNKNKRNLYNASSRTKLSSKIIPRVKFEEIEFLKEE